MRFETLSNSTYTLFDYSGLSHSDPRYLPLKRMETSETYTSEEVTPIYFL